MMLAIGATWIETEKQELMETKKNYMAENCPNPDLSGDMAALVVGLTFMLTPDL